MALQLLPYISELPETASIVKGITYSPKIHNLRRPLIIYLKPKVKKLIKGSLFFK